MGFTDASRSLWHATTPQPAFERLNHDLEVDVAVVGGGITGLTLGLLLSRAGLAVAVLDSGLIGYGDSGMTTAHLTAAVDMGYVAIRDAYDRTTARLVAESSMAAIDFIEQLVQRERIDCDFKRVSGYWYAEAEADLAALRDELAVMQMAGLPASWVDSVPLPFATAGGIELSGQARFNPAPYMLAMAQAIERYGGTICEFSPVTSIEEGEPCVLTCGDVRVTAREVTIATHSPINDRLLFTKLAPYRSSVLALRLDAATPPPSGLFWDSADPYHYTRAAHDQQGPLLVVGGADFKTGQCADTTQPFAELEAYARERYAVREVAYRWSGQWYAPADKLPLIGAYPLRSHVYVATGYSGNGMTFGTLAGMLLADALLGRSNELSAVYSPERLKLLTAAPAMLREGLDSALHFVGDRLSSDLDDLSALAPDTGALMRIDGQQLAVYRDAQGTPHALAPTCTHLGCIVQWNQAERSWDCPCHGGRFSPEGTAIQGPPTASLEPRPLPEDQ